MFDRLLRVRRSVILRACAAFVTDGSLCVRLTDQVTAILTTTECCTHAGSFGFSNSTSWGGLSGEFFAFWLASELSHYICLQFMVTGDDWCECSIQLIILFHVTDNTNSYLPYAGWLTIAMTEKPVLKVCMLGASCFVYLCEKRRW